MLPWHASARTERCLLKFIDGHSRPGSHPTIMQVLRYVLIKEIKVPVKMSLLYLQTLTIYFKLRSELNKKKINFSVLLLYSIGIGR